MKYALGLIPKKVWRMRVFLYGVVSLVVKLRIVIPSSWVQFPYDTPCLVNSAVECLPYKEKVGGSIPSQGTKIVPDS